MNRPHLIFLVALTVACGDDPCPPGEMLVGAACIPAAVDGGPTPAEVCNGVDDDSDGVVDEADPELGMACSEDVGACTVGTFSCVEGSLVCDGTLPEDETCNAMDDDCDGAIDETALFTFYLDEDGDTFGGEMTCEACAVEECGEGAWVLVGGDCDDTCESCFEGGTEVCDALDNDCDSETDEDVEILVYPDMDGDGFGVGEGVPQCEASVGFSDAGGDCADGDSRAFPGATEFYETPIMGETTGPAFDYDCDGEEFKEHTPCGSGICRNGFCYNAINDECGEDNQLREVEVLFDRCTVPGGSPSTMGVVRCR